MNSKKKVEVDIINMLGNTIYKKTYNDINSIILKTEHITSGIYMVRIHTGDSNDRIFKLIKK